MAKINYDKQFQLRNVKGSPRALDEWLARSVYFPKIILVANPMDIEEKYILRQAALYLTPNKVICNGPATIFFWPDRTKTIVKLSENDTYDFANAYANAVMQKLFGNKSWVKRAGRVCVDQNEQSENHHIKNLEKGFDNNAKSLAQAISNFRFA